jgi:hypothetical protein
MNNQNATETKEENDYEYDATTIENILGHQKEVLDKIEREKNSDAIDRVVVYSYDVNNMTQTIYGQLRSLEMYTCGIPSLTTFSLSKNVPMKTYKYSRWETENGMRSLVFYDHPIEK